MREALNFGPHFPSVHTPTKVALLWRGDANVLNQRGPATSDLYGSFYKNATTRGPLPIKWCNL